jgi:hypothetical protein
VLRGLVAVPRVARGVGLDPCAEDLSPDRRAARLSTQAHGSIGAGNRELEAAGLSVILRSGLDDPIVGLITRLRDAAEAFADLNLVSRATPPTDEENAAQAAAVTSAADDLATRLHESLLIATAR